MSNAQGPIQRALGNGDCYNAARSWNERETGEKGDNGMPRLQRVRLRVREIAQGQGWTIAGLERRVGADIKTIRKVWHDPCHPVALTTLERLAEALGVSVTTLLEDVPPEGGNEG